MFIYVKVQKNIQNQRRYLINQLSHCKKRSALLCLSVNKGCKHDVSETCVSLLMFMLVNKCSTSVNDKSGVLKQTHPIKIT